MSVSQLNEDTLPRVSVLCLTAGGALILRCSGFGLALMSFFIFHFKVGSETVHIHKYTNTDTYIIMLKAT